MHSAQRHALLAIILMIEQGLLQIKGLLMVSDEGQIPVGKTGSAAGRSVAAEGYLSDEEEKELERTMDRDREELLRAAETERLRQIHELLSEEQE